MPDELGRHGASSRTCRKATDPRPAPVPAAVHCRYTTLRSLDSPVSLAWLEAWPFWLPAAGRVSPLLSPQLLPLIRPLLRHHCDPDRTSSETDSSPCLPPTQPSPVQPNRLFRFWGPTNLLPPAPVPASACLCLRCTCTCLHAPPVSFFPRRRLGALSLPFNTIRILPLPRRRRHRCRRKLRAASQPLSPLLPVSRLSLSLHLEPSRLSILTLLSVELQSTPDAPIGLGGYLGALLDADLLLNNACGPLLLLLLNTAPACHLLCQS